ncbi:MAG: RCC1 repeat-containing protein, partial [Sandaracinaceae bacterium]|nr:RCC1 repeat-containing protein [Sandaracinaceae bacterium]
CWGSGLAGKLGDGTENDHATPSSVPGLTSVVQIETGLAHTCALLSDGSVSCWGRNESGESGQPMASSAMCGTGTPFPCIRSPMPVAGLPRAVGISIGGNTSCAALEDGRVMCWGANSNGGLGIGTSDSDPHPSPTAVLAIP